MTVQNRAAAAKALAAHRCMQCNPNGQHCVCLSVCLSVTLVIHALTVQDIAPYDGVMYVVVSTYERRLECLYFYKSTKK